jgi:O-antigen ligase
MTKSRGPLLGALTGLAVAVATALRRRRYAFVVAAAAVAAILLFAAAHPGARLSGALSPGSRSVGVRTVVWSKTADLVLDRPLLGHGLGSYPHLGVVYNDERGGFPQTNAHSTWLHVACETGVLGAGTLALFVVLGLVGIVQVCRRPCGLERAVSVGALGGVVVLLVAGVFSVTTDAEPGMLFFSLMALGSAGAMRGRDGRGTGHADEN